jgi:hypothetical protein
MTRQLQIGDVFTSRRLARLKGDVKWLPSGEPYIDATVLRPLDYPDQHDAPVFCPWTERGEDGWERKRETKLDAALDFTGVEWVVVDAKMGGGGTAHGPHDVYPDGWMVTATRKDDPKVTLRFYQSGCFNGLLTPEEIDAAIPEER